MTGFLRAHGYDPGPTQRPMLAGIIVGLLATLPATGILILFGSLASEAKILGLSNAETLFAGVIAMGLAGGAYSGLFRRAANDRRGGWLFGAAFGFLLWTGGAVMVLPALGHGRTPAGHAAIGIFLSLVFWGASAGALFPIIHRHLRASADIPIASRRRIGPSAAALKRKGPGR